MYKIPKEHIFADAGNVKVECDIIFKRDESICFRSSQYQR